LIENCYIHDNYDDGVDPNGETDYFVRNCHIVDNQYKAVDFDIYNTTRNTRVGVIGCTIRGWGIGVKYTDWAIIAGNLKYKREAATDYAVWVENSKFVAIVGNNFYSRGADIGDGNVCGVCIKDSERVLVASNYLHPLGDTARWAIGVNNGKYCLISSNLITSDVTGWQGIHFLNDAAYAFNVVENNHMVGSERTPLIDGYNVRTFVRRNYGYVTENSGVATFSGDGVTTSFSWAHGLVSTPNVVLVTPKSADAAITHSVSADATNITIKFTSAPAAGTDNVVLEWYAEV